MGHEFSLILSREITNDESAVLQESGCHGASFGAGSLPTNAEVTVTKVDIDDTVSPSLAEAIESALESVKNVPDLSVPALTVPALPVEKRVGNPGVAVGEVIEDELSAGDKEESGEANAQKPGTRKASARKPGTRKASAKKPANGKAAESADDAKELSATASAADS